MSVSFDESAESTRIVDHAVLTEAKLFQVRELFFFLITVPQSHLPPVPFVSIMMLPYLM